MKRFLKRLALGILLALPWIGAASAQQVNLYCQAAAGPPQVWVPCSSTTPLQTTASVSVSIGAVTAASGSYASGALSSGSVVDLGAKADSTCGTATGTCSEIALQKYLNNSVANDPCLTGTKASAPINVTSATTTSLVAVSGATTVYVCGFTITIAPSATSADTALFEYGTGAACSSPVALTGTFGNGDLTSAAPVVPVSYGGAGMTVFKSATSNGICILTAGTAVSVQGVISYVQQ